MTASLFTLLSFVAWSLASRCSRYCCAMAFAKDKWHIEFFANTVDIMSYPNTQTPLLAESVISSET